MEITLSPSKIFAFETCPKKFYLQYIQKALPTKKYEYQMHMGTLVHRCLELLSAYPVRENIEECLMKSIKDVDFVATPEMVSEAKGMVENWFTDDKFKNEQLSAEYKFKISLDTNITINGIIDRVEKVSEKCIKVIDYKTGYKIYTRDDIYNSNQLIIYAMAAYDKWPVETIIVQYDMVNYGRTVECMVKYDDFVEKYKYLQQIYQRIANNEKNAVVSDGCAWCGFKYNCHEYIDYTKSVLQIKDIHDILNGNFNDTIKYLVDLEEKQKLLESQISEIRKNIMNNMLSSGVQIIPCDFYDVRVTAPNKREYDTKVVAEIFADKLETVLKPVKSNVDKLLPSKTVEEKARILATAREVGGTPYLRISKKK